MDEALYFKDQNNSVFIRAEGHITAALCVDLRKKVYGRLKGPSSLEKVVFDLSHCDYMDSTFMGLLVGFNKKLQVLTGHPLTIANPSDVCLDLLTKLGVIHLLDIERSYNVQFPKDMELISQISTPTLSVLLQTHEDLSSLSEENRKKFSTLTKILRSQIKDEGSSKKDPSS